MWECFKDNQVVNVIMDEDPLISTDPWKQILKTDPCLYFFEYSPDVLKRKQKF